MQNLVIKPAARKQKKKGKRPDKRPARLRYWMSGRLEERKIRNLMKYCGMSRQSAYKRWHNTRKGRVKDGILRQVA